MRGQWRTKRSHYITLEQNLISAMPVQSLINTSAWLVGGRHQDRFVASFGSSIAGLFRFWFVVWTSSFIGSMWASGLVLDLRSWRASLSYSILGSRLSEGPLVVLGSVFFIWCLLFYLLVVLRCGRLLYASQLGWLSQLWHAGANIGQTQLQAELAQARVTSLGLASLLWCWSANRHLCPCVARLITRERNRSHQHQVDLNWDWSHYRRFI